MPRLYKTCALALLAALPAAAFDLRGFISSELAAGRTHIVVPPGRYRVEPEHGRHLLFRQLTDRLTLVLAPDVEVDDARLSVLERGGVRIVRGTATRLVVDADRLVAVELDDGTLVDADVVAVGPRFRARTEPFSSIVP